MKVYDAATIRNIALVGHTSSGKTQLASAMLAVAGMLAMALVGYVLYARGVFDDFQRLTLIADLEAAVRARDSSARRPIAPRTASGQLVAPVTRTRMRHARAAASATGSNGSARSATMRASAGASEGGAVPTRATPAARTHPSGSCVQLRKLAP